jgi:hypothetical protein
MVIAVPIRDHLAHVAGGGPGEGLLLRRRRDARLRAAALTGLSSLTGIPRPPQTEPLSLGLELRVVRWRLALQLPPRLIVVCRHRQHHRLVLMLT